MIRVWRLTRLSRAATAFTGEGTRLTGSRWTHPGLPAVYTSGSIALAVLESLVHMDITHAGPHVVIPATIPDGVAIETLDIARLPQNWYITPAPAVLRDFGSDWLKTQRTAVLAVPSAIVNDESNYISPGREPTAAGGGDPEHPSCRLYGARQSRGGAQVRAPNPRAGRPRRCLVARG